MTVTRRAPINWNSQRSEGRPLVSVTKDGKPVEGFDPDRIINVSVEEEVLKLTNAGHIHAWFVRNVKGISEAGNGPVRVTMRDLSSLLAACEKVLFASQLVPVETFSRENYDWWSSEAKNAVGNPRKAIKNVNVAHRELPASEKYGGTGEYDEEYLKAVEDTRNLIARLKCEQAGRTEGEFYYSSSRYW